MKKPTLIPLCLFAACGFMLHAEDAAGNTDTPAQESKVYYLKNQDNSSINNAWITPGHWVETYEDGVFSGASPTAITANDEFVVPGHTSAWTLRTLKSSLQFPGKRLTLGKLSKIESKKRSYRGRIRHSVVGADVYVEYCNEGLFLDDISPKELSQKLSVKVTPTESAADTFLTNLLGLH